MTNKKAIIVITCGALVVTISMGVRQAFGIFLQPISQDLGTGREVYSLAIALQNLILGVPLMAMIADRFGPRLVVLGGGVLYGAALLLLPMTGGVVRLYLNLGLLTGLALSRTTYAVVLGAVARVVEPKSKAPLLALPRLPALWVCSLYRPARKPCSPGLAGKHLLCCWLPLPESLFC